MLTLPASLSRATLWETRDWALTGNVSTTAGYDSNITMSHDGPEDEYIQLQPQVTLLRRNSETDFHTDLSLVGTDFLHGRQTSQTDVNFSSVFAYPSGPDLIPRYTSSLTWQRTADPNPYLGHRVRHARGEFAAEAFAPISGKLGARGEVDGYVDNYVGPTFNHNQHWRIFGGLTYEKRPGLEGSANIGYAEGKSQPNSGQPAIRSTETYVTAKARGTLTAKLTGSVYAGFGQVEYKGGYQNRENMPVAGADITWGIDPRRTLVLAAYSGADYAPDGQAVNTSHAFLSFTHVVIGRWQYILRGGPTHTVFRREIRQSTDDAWEGGVEFAYIPSQKFRVSTGLTGRTQDSDMSDRRYDRVLFSVGSSYRF